MAGPDYPQGDGYPECPLCQGRGVVPTPLEKRHPLTIGPQTQVCPCVHRRDVLLNMERCWKGLSKAQRIPESPLQGREAQNLWITAGEQALRSHLKAVVGRHHSHWYLAVITDIDLMDSWLHHIPDYEMLDVDVLDKRQKGRPTDRYTALVDLMEPPELLVIRLGIKVTRNVAAPEVLLETLKHRQHKDKFTWIVDEAGKPFSEGHISWSPQVSEFLSDWEHLNLSSTDTPNVNRSTLKGYQPQAPSDQKETTSLLGTLSKPKKEKKVKK